MFRKTSCYCCFFLFRSGCAGPAPEIPSAICLGPQGRTREGMVELEPGTQTGYAYGYLTGYHWSLRQQPVWHMQTPALQQRCQQTLRMSRSRNV